MDDSLHTEQYFALFPFETNPLPQIMQIFVFFGLASSIYKSLSAGSTAILNHLQIICE